MISQATESLVSQILIRRLNPDVKKALQARAQAQGRSLEAEARAILTSAVTPADDNLATLIHGHFSPLAVTADELASLPRDRGLRDPFGHDPA
jgi:plasmid stability protein